MPHVDYIADTVSKGLAKKGQDGDAGWTKGAYWASKAFVNAMTEVLARENPQLTVNCCCPGWVQTPLGTMVTPPGAIPALTPGRLASHESLIY